MPFDGKHGGAENLNSEMRRIFELGDIWLARELLRLARTTRRSAPSLLGNPNGEADLAALVWHVVPEVARRLGAKDLHPNESSVCELRVAGRAVFRRAVGRHLKACEANGEAWNGFGRPSCLTILTNPIVDGNPTAMALDRVFPPSGELDFDDWIACSVRRASRNRNHEERISWHPDLQSPPSARFLPFRRL